MKRLSIVLLIALCFCSLSCNKEKIDESLAWVQGTYSGTYTKEIRVDGKTSSKTSDDIKAKVTLHSDRTLTIILRGAINSTLSSKPIEVNEGPVSSISVNVDGSDVFEVFEFRQSNLEMRSSYYSSESYYSENIGHVRQWFYTISAYQDFD